MYRTDFWALWEKARVGWSERIALKHVYYQGWNRSPAQVGCMRQVLGPGALGRPRGMGWGGRREGGSGRGARVNPWLIHVNVWQKPLQYCKVISLQLINRKNKSWFWNSRHLKFWSSHTTPPPKKKKIFHWEKINISFLLAALPSLRASGPSSHKWINKWVDK